MSAKIEQILCVDVGGDSIKVAEFSYPEDGTVVLDRFSFSEYGIGETPKDDESYSLALTENLRNIIVENGYKSKKVYLSLSGQNAFIRFVKVPAMADDEAKVKQILDFEAKQNIPFPVDQVVYDHQLISAGDENGEIEAMFVIVKSEDIENLAKIIEETGKEVSLIEVAPTACYNAARANMIGEEQCEMILNIGGRCSTLIFVDKGAFFVRTILIAGHTITQQISKEFGISFADAEELKRRHGFVALGGAYEEPESEVAATVSKIVRNVMTRLHGEINRSINVYRAQQKGRKPEKLYLAGGSSVMAFTPRFFSEKLRIPVEYFNPFQVVGYSPEVNKDSLAEVAHMFSEVIGLALRNAASCPIEVSLLPEKLRRQNKLRQKLPYFYASCAALVFCLGITYWSFAKQLNTASSNWKRVKEKLASTKNMVNQVSSAKSSLDDVAAKYKEASNLLAGREVWTNLLNAIQTAVPPEMWFTSIHSAVNLQNDAPSAENRSAPEAPRGFLGFRRQTRSEESSRQQTNSPDIKWIVFVGHIRTSAPEGSKGVPSAGSVYEKFKKNLEKTGIFRKFTIKDEDRMSRNFKLALPGTNISSFQIEAELLQPIKK